MHLLVQKGHRYLKLKLQKQLGDFEIESAWYLLTENKKMTNYDLETLLIDYRKAGSRSLVSDIDLLLYAYNDNELLTISDFINKL